MAKPTFVKVPWWKRIPGRLEYEFERLEEAGFKYTVDAGLKAKGILQMTVEYRDNGKVIPLKVTFPDLYPYFRFFIAAPTDLGFKHHQVPFSGDLCLMGRATRYWSTHDTLAGILRDQVPKVFAAARAVSFDALSVTEEEQAEPYSDYYPYMASAMFVIDGNWSVEKRNIGRLSGGLLGMQEFNGVPVVRGVVLKVRDRKDQVFQSADEGMQSIRWSHPFSGRWVRLDEPLATNDAATAWKLLEDRDSKTSELEWVQVAPSLDIRVRAAIFPEENAHRATQGEGWLFLVQCRRPAKGARSMPALPSKIPGARPVTSEPYGQAHYFARAGRMGERDLAERIPELASLRQKKIVVVGAGCLGAPSALEFARAQVGVLEILDGDHFDPATASRWAFGLTEAGNAKVLSLKDFVSNQYPFTKITAHPRRLGGFNSDKTDDQLLREMLDSTSLLYDASAEIGVQQVLAEYAREARIPYVSVTGTHGGWGGRIVRIRPGITAGCWVCLQMALENGDVPIPPAMNESLAGHTIQPEGCADPTFTGAGFDMSAVALIGVRAAVQTLAQKKQGEYPDLDWDVATVSFRDLDGNSITPKFETFQIPKYSTCENCATT